MKEIEVVYEKEVFKPLEAIERGSEGESEDRRRGGGF